LPNVISLPYGKQPLCHILASGWRQLLKLMVKLCATRVEPSIEAVAAKGDECRLRTVIQFFKVSQGWVTILYISIDHPPPPGGRSTNGDVNALPYSFSLSPIPALLGDGPDSKGSKYYTIPETSRTPFPRLPVTMPDMAMYLSSALEDSRRAPSGSIRRLAKMVDKFYPHRPNSGEAGKDVQRRGRVCCGLF